MALLAAGRGAEVCNEAAAPGRYRQSSSGTA